MIVPDALVAVFNPHKAGVGELLNQLHAWCETQGWGFLSFQAFGQAPKELPGQHPLGLSLGGDGTLLLAAHRLMSHAIPLLGVNLGSLGFLSPLQVDALWQGLEHVKQGCFQIEARMCLETTVAKTYYALNELAILHPVLDQITEVLLYRGEEFVASYPGDGLIIATPTGSTAYSLAAGGPLLSPELNVILVTPINPHKLGLRPLVFSGDTALTVELKGKASLVVDGDIVESLDAGTRFQVNRSSKTVKLIQLEDSLDWFTLLEDKLHWQRHSPRKTYGGSPAP